MPLGGAAETDTSARRVFRFGTSVFNEATQDLLVDGATRPLETKPRLLLGVLLSQANMVVSKADLKRAVWPEKQFVEEGSLTTAVYSLRAALGPAGRDIVKSVPGVGYQIAVKVEVGFINPLPLQPFAGQAGETVAGRPQWRLVRPLSVAPVDDVWLARHDKTPELRVFKFAASADRLDTLKREAALSRILRDALGERDDIVPVLEWNFETPPYFIELPYAGSDLPAWLHSVSGQANSLEARIALVAAAARTVADAHGAGVLHGDVKPGNILISEAADGALRPCLVDFGAGGLTEAARNALLTVSLRSDSAGATTKSGTLLYSSPEVLKGGPPTVAADVYALGIVLYQMIVGDFAKPLAAGWEQDIADPLLRQDIADAACGDLEFRLSSAAALADRLCSLEARASARERLALEAKAASDLAEMVRRSRLRRPWIVLACAVLALGSLAVGLSARQVARERDQAVRQARIAKAVNLFLTDDLLGRGNPASSGKANETLMEAATKAEPRIALRLPTEPLVAASIYVSLAEAFESRSAYAEARQAYDQAVDAFQKAEGDYSADGLIARLKRARMEAEAADAGSLQKARSLIAGAEHDIDRLGNRSLEARVWLLSAKGWVEMTGGSVTLAQQDFRQASDLADQMPDLFDQASRLVLRQRQAKALFRLGKWDQAAALLNDLLRQQIALHGQLHPDTLLVKLALAQVAMGRGDAQQAVNAISAVKPDLVAVFGADHHVVLQALSIRAEASGLLGKYDDAVADDREIYRATVAKQGEESQYAIYPLNDEAESLCRAGRGDEGYATASRAYHLALTAFPSTPAIPQAVSAQMAFCLIVQKQYQQAKAILGGIDRKAVAELIANPDVGAGIDLMLADIADASGNEATARQLLGAPVIAFDREGADPYTRRWVQRLEQATAPPH